MLETQFAPEQKDRSAFDQADTGRPMLARAIDHGHEGTPVGIREDGFGRLQSVQPPDVWNLTFPSR